MNNAILVWDGKTLRVPTPPMCDPAGHQLQSTDLDNLIELSGRACYDSVGLKKSRNSVEYHQHIQEVGHLSVQEHANFTVEYGKYLDQKRGHYRDDAEVLGCFVNRPGIWVRFMDNCYRLTVNIRTVREWGRFGLYSTEHKALGTQLKDVAKELCPLAMFDWEASDKVRLLKVVEPETDEEVWASVYFHDLSRGFSHELVRHGDFTAISQRSTRYVDENESRWAWHPLITEYVNSGGDLGSLLQCEFTCREAYGDAVKKLESHLIAKGVDKFTARKQARGAARGVLGNALATELMFSASIAQWKWMLHLRASGHADAEIRVAFNQVFRVLMQSFPNRFAGWSERPAPDGIGYEVIPPSEWNKPFAEVA